MSSKKNIRSSFSQSSSNRLNYQNLEPRQLLASIVFDMPTGVVTLNGDNANDIGLVRSASASTVDVVLVGTPTQTFNTADVTSIVFVGHGGNDFFRNDTAITSTAFGGEGMDTLLGGSGNDLLVGQNGIDRLLGRDGIDRLYGQSGNDILIGGRGNDRLFGGDDDDYIQGDSGNDTVFGGNGNDTAVGSDGDDILFGQMGNDILIGGAGNDQLWGFLGNDTLRGNAGNDQLIGGDGVDLLTGSSGNDTLRGGLGNDTLYGGDGNDNLFGDNGEDIIAGQNGNDTIMGGAGNDTIFGNGGRDLIWAGLDNDSVYSGAGNDFINGQQGNDVLNGFTGDDEIHGGAGNDMLIGGAGNDSLFGEQGIDSLSGNAGYDGLFGGVDPGDTLIGGDQNDRFLYVAGDIIQDQDIFDARIDFRNGSSQWADGEIEAIDDGLRKLHLRVNNTRLLKDPQSVANPIVFIKELALPPSPRLGTNQFVEVTRNIFNPGTGTTVTTTFKERQIRFGEWDETNLVLSQAITTEVPREIAHSWASNEQILAAIPTQPSYWNSFTLISGWTDKRPDDISFYDISLDNKWFHLADADFVENYSKTNPVEDFASAWKLYFDSGPVGAEKQRLVVKLGKVDELFSMLFTPAE